jgi:sterol desaturase/sphingolipid hydroxylase (fatty acid hydroxylase superfamily)
VYKRQLEAVVIFQVIYQAHTLLIHANTRLRFGPLKWLIASPEYHHWHHANEPDAYDRNFAAQLSLIDWIAGTLFLPLRRPSRYGINEEMPRWYHQQLLHPFRSLGRMARRKPPSPERTPHEQDA